jgi:hypothetical protein
VERWSLVVVSVEKNYEPFILSGIVINTTLAWSAVTPLRPLEVLKKIKAAALCSCQPRDANFHSSGCKLVLKS